MILIVLALLSVVGWSKNGEEKEELLKVVMVQRHCDRSSLEHDVRIPVLHMNEDVCTTYDIDPLTMTPLGEKECYELGQSVRDRYLDPESKFHLKGIRPFFSDKNYKFYSSGARRTIRSTQALSFAMFGEGSRIVGNPNFSLMQTIPIHVKQKVHDRLLKEIDNCHSLISDYVGVWEAKETNEEYVHRLEDIADFLELPKYQISTFDKLHLVFDKLYVYNNHGKLDAHPDIKEYFLSTVAPFMKEVWRMRYHDDVIKKRSGTALLNDIVNGMEHYNKDDPKFVHYSTHDSMIGTLLADLRIYDDYEDLWDVPGYGAALFFELIDDGDDKFVRILYKNQYDAEFRELELKTFDCKKGGEKCLYPNFYGSVKDIYLQNEDWCVLCQNYQTDICLNVYITDYLINQVDIIEVQEAYDDLYRQFNETVVSFQLEKEYLFEELYTLTSGQSSMDQEIQSAEDEISILSLQIEAVTEEYEEFKRNVSMTKRTTTIMQYDSNAVVYTMFFAVVALMCCSSTACLCCVVYFQRKKGKQQNQKYQKYQKVEIHSSSDDEEISEKELLDSIKKSTPP